MSLPSIPISTRHPPDTATHRCQPSSAYFDQTLGEFVLRYADLRAADSPEEMLLAFFQSTYEAAANLAGWDREALEMRVPG